MSVDQRVLAVGVSACQNVMSTGPSASSRASTGHGRESAAPRPGWWSAAAAVVGRWSWCRRHRHRCRRRRAAPAVSIGGARTSAPGGAAPASSRSSVVAGVEDRLADAARRREQAGRDSGDRSRRQRRRAASSLDRSGGEAADELALEDQQHGDRDRGDDRARHQQVRRVEALQLEPRSPDCTVFMSSSVVIRLGHRYAFQVPRKANRASAPSVGRINGTATWRRKPRWPTPSMSAASRRSRGQRQQHLAHQERAERRGEERHREALVGVQPAERVDGPAVDDDRRLERHQQRGEEHDEDHVLAGEVEHRERVRRTAREVTTWAR